MTFTSRNNHFLFFHIKLYEKQVSLINKLHPLSCQFTSNITPRFPLHASQPTLNYTTLLHYSHIPNTHKIIETSNTRVVHRRPNIRSHSVLLIRTFLSRMSKDGNKERHFLFWRRRINWVKRKLPAAPPNLHRHVHFLRYLREELVFKKPIHDDH